MRITAIIVLAALAAIAVSFGQDWFAELARWAVQKQRAFQGDLASAVRALRTGEPGAWLALLGAAGAYGFVHAVGPGHGKYLIGGVGLGSSVPVSRLLGIALASSLAQALWAILLVYGGFLVLEISAQRMTALAEEYLAPASYLAIAMIGAVLVWRGARTLYRHAVFGRAHARHHAHGECGCHAHGPMPEDVATLSSFRDAAALIVSIAIRPCTGAIILLVIAWQMDIHAAGAAAVITMGLGTSLLTSLVAVSSVAARGLAYTSIGKMGAVALAAPSLQMLAGILIVWFSVLILRSAAF